MAPQALEVSDRRLPDYRLDEIKLDPATKTIKAAGIAEALTDDGGLLTLTIQGASTLELFLSDPDKALLRSDLLTAWTWGEDPSRDEKRWIKRGRRIDLSLDDLRFRLKRVEKQENRTLALQAEELAVAKLRAKKGARSWTRGAPGTPGVTRAQAVRSMADEAGVPWHIPELSDPQPTDVPKELTQQQQKTRRNQRAAKGVSRVSGITVKGAKASPEQLQNITDALDECSRLKAPELATLAALVAGTAEGGWLKASKNPTSTARGPYQILDSTARAVGVSPTDVKAATHRFLTHGFGGDQRGAIKIARQEPRTTPGAIANICEAGGAGAAFYDAWRAEAKRTLAAYGGVSTKSGGTTVVVEKAFQFTRGRNEDSWDAIQRLADEVNWRAFIRKGVLWYLSDEALMGQEPALVAHEPEPGEKFNGIHRILVPGIDLGARDVTADLTIIADVERTAVLPGMVIRVQREGPADGKWLLRDITRPLWDETGTLACVKPTGKKNEPAAETETVTFGGTLQELQGGKVTRASVKGMTPKQIIDTFVLPVARKAGAHTPSGGALTPANNDAANRAHTHLGSASDHAGPPAYKWAADLSIGPDVRYGNAAGAKIGDEIAATLASMFGIPFPRRGGGLKSATHFGFRFQLIWRYEDAQAGNHYTHVHFGVRRESGPVPPVLPGI